jgi:hypothetical protein
VQKLQNKLHNYTRSYSAPAVDVGLKRRTKKSLKWDLFPLKQRNTHDVGCMDKLVVASSGIYIGVV